MTAIRRDGPTPNGGDYAILTFVNLQTLEEVDEQDATGVMIGEYTLDGALVFETVGEVAASPASA